MGIVTARLVLFCSDGVMLIRFIILLAILTFLSTAIWRSVTTSTSTILSSLYLYMVLSLLLGSGPYIWSRKSILDSHLKVVELDESASCYSPHLYWLSCLSDSSLWWVPYLLRLSFPACWGDLQPFKCWRNINQYLKPDTSTYWSGARNDRRLQRPSH